MIKRKLEADAETHHGLWAKATTRWGEGAGRLERMDAALKSSKRSLTEVLTELKALFFKAVVK